MDMYFQEINYKLFRGKSTPAAIKKMMEYDLLPPRNIIEWKSTFIGTFLTKNPRYYGIILTIADIFGHLPYWQDFTRANIRAIVEHYTNQCSQSSARTYMAQIKGSLNDCENKDLIPCKDFAKELIVKNVPSVAIYLNQLDISKLENYTPESAKERIILAQFLCACYTGARHSDILAMTAENIQGEYIIYVSKKTHKEAKIEAKKGLAELLRVAQLSTYADSTFNLCIRDICKKAGINDKVRIYKAGKYVDGYKYDFVSSHTGRRSFASNLASLNVPIREISLRMGHSDITVTQRYILAPISELNDSAQKYFE